MSFWKWWTTIVTVVVGFTAAEFYLNIIDFFTGVDNTRISIIIFGIFCAVNIALGFYAYMIQFKKKRISEQTLQTMWFFSDAVMSIGMVGTLIGFLVVLTTVFTDIDTTSSEAMKEVIGNLANGMGIALTTSLCGLITSILLKFELVLLELDNEKI
jgi:hypothetical protein